MNDYKNNGDTTEVFGRHPLYVKPETVARFRPKYLGYALSKDEVASLTKKGAIGPNRGSGLCKRIPVVYVFSKMN